ncbi:MAG TPA: hypothetical protein VHA07_11905 [Devosia sp.]|nr:hypothetical protein [Devosia sp.]
MPRLLVALLGTAMLAALALPAQAQPLVITVPGGTPIYPGLVLPPGGSYPLVTAPPQIGGRFDPAQAALNAMATVPWARHAGVSQALSPALVDTLLRTGDSFAEHWTKCQARFGTFSLADDTYLGADGIPRNCPL